MCSGRIVGKPKLPGLVLVFRDLRSNLHLSSFHHQKLLSSFSPTTPKSSRECFFGANEIGMAGNQSAEDLVMSRASARFTNFPPCFL